MVTLFSLSRNIYSRVLTTRGCLLVKVWIHEEEQVLCPVCGSQDQLFTLLKTLEVNGEFAQQFSSVDADIWLCPLECPVGNKMVVWGIRPVDGLFSPQSLSHITAINQTHSYSLHISTIHNFYGNDIDVSWRCYFWWYPDYILMFVSHFHCFCSLSAKITDSENLLWLRWRVRVSFSFQWWLRPHRVKLEVSLFLTPQNVITTVIR